MLERAWNGSALSGSSRWLFPLGELRGAASRIRGTARVSPQSNTLGESRWELPAKKRRGGSGERGSVALPRHVTSGPDPAIYAARQISGRPCVPGRLWKNRAPADSLRLEFFGSGSCSSAGGRLFEDFRPRRASRRSCARTEPTGPKPTRPEKRKARLAVPLNRLFSSWCSADTGCRETGDLL
jgi:hypothetical protein